MAFLEPIVSQEIERKYLVTGSGWRAAVSDRHEIVQAYLAVTKVAEIRVRIIDGTDAVLTVKSETPALIREEIEFSLPIEQAQDLLALRIGNIVRKVRHSCRLPSGARWEIDEFLGDLANLVLAEIELPDPDVAVEQLDWLGEEVTGNPEYYNAHLAGAKG